MRRVLDSSPALFFPSLGQKGVKDFTLSGISQLWLEQGFKHGPSLNTSRSTEFHKRVGPLASATKATKSEADSALGPKVTSSRTPLLVPRAWAQPYHSMCHRACQPARFLSPRNIWQCWRHFQSSKPRMKLLLLAFGR